MIVIIEIMIVVMMPMMMTMTMMMRLSFLISRATSICFSSLLKIRAIYIYFNGEKMSEYLNTTRGDTLEKLISHDVRHVFHPYI